MGGRGDRDHLPQHGASQPDGRIDGPGCALALRACGFFTRLSTDSVDNSRSCTWRCGGRDLAMPSRFPATGGPVTELTRICHMPREPRCEMAADTLVRRTSGIVVTQPEKRGWPVRRQDRVDGAAQVIGGGSVEVGIHTHAASSSCASTCRTAYRWRSATSWQAARPT